MHRSGIVVLRDWFNLSSKLLRWRSYLSPTCNGIGVAEFGEGYFPTSRGSILARSGLEGTGVLVEGPGSGNGCSFRWTLSISVFREAIFASFSSFDSFFAFNNSSQRSFSISRRWSVDGMKPRGWLEVGEKRVRQRVQARSELRPLQHPPQLSTPQARPVC
jgi:hypothetical protein